MATVREEEKQPSPRGRFNEFMHVLEQSGAELTPEERHEAARQYISQFYPQFRQQDFRAKQGFFSTALESWRRGVEDMAHSVRSREVMKQGGQGFEEVRAERERRAAIWRRNPIEGRNLAEDIVFGGTRMVPRAGKGLIKGGAWGLAAMGTAALMSQLIPGPLDEPITIGAVGKAAHSLGAFKFWQEQIEGDLYYEMREMGVPHDIASKVAIMGSIPSAAIEFLQITHLTPGMRGPAAKVAKRTAIGAIAGILKRATITYGTEMTEEAGQFVVDEAAKEFGKAWSNTTRGTDLEALTFDELAEKGLAEMKAAATGLPLLLAPGAAADASVEARNVMADRTRRAGRAKLGELKDRAERTGVKLTPRDEKLLAQTSKVLATPDTYKKAQEGKWKGAVAAVGAIERIESEVAAREGAAEGKRAVLAGEVPPAPVEPTVEPIEATEPMQPAVEAEAEDAAQLEALAETKAAEETYDESAWEPIDIPPPTPPPGGPAAEGAAEFSENVKPGVLTHAWKGWNRIFSVENTYRLAGIPTTGLAVKLLASTIDVEHTRGFRAARAITRLHLSETDQRDLLFMYADKRFVPTAAFKKTERGAKVIKGLALMREYFEGRSKAALALKAMWKAWPLSEISRQQAAITDFNAKISEAQIAGDDALVARYVEKVMEAQDAIKFLQTQRYVPITQVWLGPLFEANPERAAHFTSRAMKKRKTLNIRQLAEDLLEARIITEKDIDARRVIGAYADHIGKVLATAKVVRAAEAEGALTSRKAQPDWPDAPWLVKKHAGIKPSQRAAIHPLLFDFFRAYEKSGANIRIGRVLGFWKMLQFTNPLILPFYDLHQAIWLGSWRSLYLPLYIRQAARAVVGQGGAEADEARAALLPKPYVNPASEFAQEIESIIYDGGTMAHIGKYIKVNMRRKGVIGKARGGLDIFMQVLWTSAWTGDEFVRWTSFYHLRRKGYSVQDAARIAARFHGDYANVPNATRLWLNRIFFTPTFPIIMAQVQWEMLSSPIKALKEAATAKKLSQRTKAMLHGLMGLGAAIAARDGVMLMLGYKRDIMGYRYTKRVRDEEGKERELVLVMPTPDNIILRWLNMVRIPATQNKIEALALRAAWRLNPVWRVAIQGPWLGNRRSDFRPVCNPFDPYLKKFKDTFRWLLPELIPLTRIAPGLRRFERREGIEAFRHDMEKLWPLAYAMERVAYTYMRGTAEQRLQYELRLLHEKARKFIMIDQRKERDPAVIDRRLRELRQQMEAVLEQLKEEKKR